MNMHLKKVAKRLSPTRFVSRRALKAIISHFAEEYGLVYFGFVSQRDDEHRIVRGLTLSNQHRDSHYCIGTYEGYDVTFVERTDTLKDASKKIHRSHMWHILAVDLHAVKEQPHVFIGQYTQSESLYLELFTKYSHMRSLSLGNTADYPHEFLAHYRVYGHPSKIIEVEATLSTLATEMISKHFGALAIEIHEGVLYVYSENPRLSPQLLEAMIKNGVWLARHMDDAAEKE